MFPHLLSTELVERIAHWAWLKQWERREIGQLLRRMGLTYKEIASIVPVSKGTLAGWCSDLELTQEEDARLLERQTDLIVSGRRLKKRRHIAWDRAEAIRVAAATEVEQLRSDAAWMAGAVAYWAEGSKRCRELTFSNSDPGLICLFLNWCRRYLGAETERFTVRLHLHSGQDEDESRRYWSEATGIPLEQFRKAFIKPEGSGHRKNKLYNGTAQIRVRRSTNDLHRVRGWIDGLSHA
jgi:hypothetical protein